MTMSASDLSLSSTPRKRALPVSVPKQTDVGPVQATAQSGTLSSRRRLVQVDVLQVTSQPPEVTRATCVPAALNARSTGQLEGEPPKSTSVGGEEGLRVSQTMTEG